MANREKGYAKICPLLSLSEHAGIHGAPCVGDECGLWDFSRYRCAMLTIAYNLGYISDSIEDFDVKGEKK